jgi:hypothetical protein
MNHYTAGKAYSARVQPLFANGANHNRIAINLTDLEHLTLAGSQGSNEAVCSYP